MMRRKQKATTNKILLKRIHVHPLLVKIRVSTTDFVGKIVVILPTTNVYVTQNTRVRKKAIKLNGYLLDVIEQIIAL
jgi:hypothetical protein